MIDNEYPIPSCYNHDNISLSEEWFEVKFVEKFNSDEEMLFKEKNNETFKPKLIAIDCEMVEILLFMLLLYLLSMEITTKNLLLI